MLNALHDTNEIFASNVTVDGMALPLLDSGGPDFKSWLGNRVYWQVNRGFPQSLKANARIVP
jgi:hypothetical protein